MNCMYAAVLLALSIVSRRFGNDIYGTRQDSIRLLDIADMR
jgi:hypothetical protein